jgi:glyoxylase-like metal-dependent hydrolase (beta-lactamase superfamily II)
LRNVQKIEKLALSTNYPIGPVNVYLVFGEKLTLIDTGLKLDRAWNELNEGLHHLGLKLGDIDQVVLTHHHNDHAGLLEWILEEHPSISVLAHKNTQIYLQDQDYLDWSGEFFEKLFYEFGLPNEMANNWAFRKRNRPPLHDLKLETVLQDGDIVPGLPDWKVIETLGHSQDHISLYHPNNQLFISGDHIIKGTHAGIFLDAPLHGDDRAKPLLQYLNNLAKCKDIPIRITHSGHGPAIEHLTEAIEAQIENIEHRAQKVINTLKKSGGSSTGFEIIQDMYRGRYEKAVITFVFEIISTLDLLQERNVVIGEKMNGVYKYYLVG